jgi:ferritin-like metal-binding protein YciE
MKKNTSSNKGSSSSKKSGSTGRSTGSSARSSSANGSRSSARSGSRTSSKKNSESGEESLKKIFVEELKDIYWAEKHLLKALPKMAKASSTEELQQAFEEHLEQTNQQVERLEQVFEICGVKAQAKKCEAMEGLVEEGQEVIDEHEEGVVRDTALIIAGQKVEHYEMAAYGSLRTLAQVMGMDDAVELLQTTLDEEGETDKLLTSIAENVNQQAMEMSGVEEDEEELA